MRCALGGGLLGALLWGNAALAQVDRHSMTGFPGMLTTPIALMPIEGSLGFGISSVQPYNSLYLSAQPFSRLNFNARYSDISDRPYRTSRNGQSYKDKGFDVAVQILPEGHWYPALSVGIVDIGGTGLFSSEYLVASQRIFDVYASIGIAWGRLGARGGFDNPLTQLSDRFRSRPGGALDGTGTFSTQRWFRGEEVGVFGSLLWNPGGGAWTFVAELDGNDYSNEPARRPIEASARFNGGVRYALSDQVSATLSYLRGNQVGFQIGITPVIGRDDVPKSRSYLPELDRNRHSAYRPADVADAERYVRLYEALRYRGFFVHALDISDDGSMLTVWQSSSRTSDPVEVQRHIGREVANVAPDSVRTIRVVTMAGGAGAMTAETPRDVIEAEASAQASVEELVVRSSFGPGDGWSLDDARYPDLLSYPTYAVGINPALRSNIGGPTDFYVGQLLLKPYTTVQLTRSFSVTGTLGVSVLNDLDRLQEPPASGSLPAVRSDLERYQSGSSNVYLDELEANFLFPIVPEWYGRLSAGIFEEMYGGVAGEVLYRPFDKRWAVSLDANYVRQRDFDQRLDFRDYKTATGHLTVYYQSPISGIDVAMSAGRYLAKDVGVTLDLSRTFRNGARFGVFATKTDVSSKQFGEGSFDKGFYIYIPLSVFSEGMKSGGTSIDYRFLSRDGGQKVDDGRKLYGVYGGFNEGAIYGR